MAEIILQLIDNQIMAASDSNGHSIVIGLSPLTQEQWGGVKPSDLLLMSVAACATYDVVNILNKRREVYHDLVVVCRGEQQNEPPYAFTTIYLSYRLTGSVDPEQFKRAIHLSVTKYCSVINSLRPDLSVTSDYEIKPLKFLKLMMLTSRFSQALSFTFELHRDQFRKGNQIPYIAHLLAVAALVIEFWRH